jgi:hypothetical protein
VHPPGPAPAKTYVFVFVVAVPALLVLLLGYSTGYGLWSRLVGGAGAEPAGWATGVLLLVATVRVALLLRRRRRR